MAAKRKALGRGLSAIMGEARTAKDDDAQLRQMPLDQIRPGRYQPRTGMDPERLQELAASIRKQGVVQPVVVRALDEAGQYELIAGERRWRAAKMAGLDRIPAIVRRVPDEVTLALALIENIQRENLNPIEEATALRRLIDEFSLTHEEAARDVGRSRASVTNLLRLLDLAPPVRELVDGRELEMGHARALLGLNEQQQTEAARRVVKLGLSVRQAEALARRLKAGPAKKASSRKSPDVLRLEQELTESLCARVSLHHAASGKGRMEIRYTSLDELEGILERLRKSGG